MTPGDFHDGVALMPGIYDYNGELHVDINEYILACGGDPASEADREAAARVIARVGAEQSIPVVEVD
jgi:hypothetical protein